ncbi:MAG TPA: cupin domain-containing protein [Candidatus Sulfotelmatobacter sp.]|nr:cupin domain-containing protein [Candidatus Sulfotelmatobacter sp.]
MPTSKKKTKSGSERTKRSAKHAKRSAKGTRAGEDSHFSQNRRDPSTSLRAGVGHPKQMPVKAALQYIPWHTIPLEDLNPLLQRQFVVGQEIMLARVLLRKGCIVPLHSHHNEQLTYIVEGALKFYIDGKEIVVHAGEVLCIPSNMPHKAEALEDTVDLDVFTPPREDWINKTDQYLRGER